MAGWASWVVPLATAAAGYLGEKKGDTSSSNIDKTSESNPWSPSQGYRLWAMRRAFEQMNRGADAPPDWLYSGRRRKGQNRTNPDTMSNHGFPGPNDPALMGLGGPGGGGGSGGGSLASSFGRDSVRRLPNGDVIDPRTGEILSGPRAGQIHDTGPATGTGRMSGPGENRPGSGLGGPQSDPGYKGTERARGGWAVGGGYGEGVRPDSGRSQDLGFANPVGGSSWFTSGSDPRIEGSRYDDWTDLKQNFNWKALAKAMGLFF